MYSFIPIPFTQTGDVYQTESVLLERDPDQTEPTAQSAQRPSYPPHARKLKKTPTRLDNLAQPV